MNFDYKKYSAEDSPKEEKIALSEQTSAMVAAHLANGGVITAIELGVTGEKRAAWMSHSMEVIERNKTKEQERRRINATFDRQGDI